MPESLQTDLTQKTELDLYYDVYVPDRLELPAPLLIAAHGYGAHKRYMMREARAVAGDRFVIASIQGPYQHFRATDDGYRVGFGWLTDFHAPESVALHHKFVKDVLSSLFTEGAVDGSGIFLYGFSQASALNFRFAFTNPEMVKGAVAVCGGVPGDLETNPLYKPLNAYTFYIYGNDDEFYSQEKFTEFDRKLKERIPNYTSKQYDAKHEITEEMRVDIRAFLDNKLSN
jgi:phospholipase/carboxylesterase